MALISGIGGVFFRATDPDKLMKWYIDTFDLQIDDGFWQQDAGDTVFQPFPAKTQYFRADKHVMINFRVTDMDAVLARLVSAGIAYWDSPDDDSAFGRFIHLEDPEGNPIELWEPLTKDASV